MAQLLSSELLEFFNLRLQRLSEVGPSWCGWVLVQWRICCHLVTKTIHENDCDEATSVQQMQVYQTEHGGHVFSFKDVEVNVKYQMMLTSTAKKEAVTQPPLKVSARTPVKDGMCAMKAVCHATPTMTLKASCSMISSRSYGENSKTKSMNSQ